MDNDSCLEVIKVDGWQVDIFSQQKIIVKFICGLTNCCYGSGLPPEVYGSKKSVCRKRSIYAFGLLLYRVKILEKFQQTLQNKKLKRMYIWYNNGPVWSLTPPYWPPYNWHLQITNAIRTLHLSMNLSNQCITHPFTFSILYHYKSHLNFVYVYLYIYIHRQCTKVTTCYIFD